MITWILEKLYDLTHKDYWPEIMLAIAIGMFPVTLIITLLIMKGCKV